MGKGQAAGDLIEVGCSKAMCYWCHNELVTAKYGNVSRLPPSDDDVIFIELLPLIVNPLQS